MFAMPLATDPAGLGLSASMLALKSSCVDAASLYTLPLCLGKGALFALAAQSSMLPDVLVLSGRGLALVPPAGLPGKPCHWDDGLSVEVRAAPGLGIRDLAFITNA